MYFSSHRATAGADKIVDVCADVGPDESVFVLTDTDKLDIGDLVAGAARKITEDVSLTVIEPRDAHGEGPPEHLAASMAEADVLIMPLTFSMTHALPAREAQEGGTRVISMGDFNWKMLEKGGIRADFLSIQPKVDRLASIFADGSRAVLTSERGTKLTMDISGRDGYAEPGVARAPGTLCSPPNIEANVGPLEGTAEGRLTVDASVPLPGLGDLEGEIEVTVEGGEIVNIEGGPEGRFLNESLEEMDDPKVFNIAELGVGMNPCSSITGSMLEDEGAYGTSHIGIGDNLSFGGDVEAASHVDLVIYNTSIEIDGKAIQEDGELLGELSLQGEDCEEH